MNRIKFRAWITRDNESEMVYLPFAGLQYFDFEGSWAISFAVDGYSGFYAHECYERIKPKFEVMQFTGLLDKNGKEIYEGDAIKTTGYYFIDNDRKETKEIDYMAYVIYKEDCACFALRASNGCETPFFFDMIELHDKAFEIIGNIYENPELINEKQKANG